MFLSKKYKLLLSGLITFMLCGTSVMTLAANNNDEISQLTINALLQEAKAPIAPAEKDIIQALSKENSQAVTEPNNINNPFTLYPIHSTITPGKIETQMHTIPQLMQHLFFVGCDDFSLSWLKEHYQQLKELNAIGFLVEAQSENDYQRIKELINAIPLIPISADAFSSAWHLTHYPVLFTSKGMIQ